MRVAFIGVSHWHTKFYTAPIATTDGMTIVGVSDPEEAAREEWATKLGTVAFSDFREMCAKTRPELVFALGRHSEMAEEAEYLIEEGIPFSMEKPAGVTVEQIGRIERLAREKKAFAGVAFAYRYSRFRRLIDELSPGSEMTYGLFRQIPGPASRYVGRDAWNLDPQIAGGGCTVNLSVHFYDLLRVLAPSEPWQVVGATMSNELSGSAVEDFSTTLLASGGRRATVETGYFFPTPEGANVLSVCVGGDFYNWLGRERTIRVTMENGDEREFDGAMSQSGYYPDLVADTILRVQEGREPDGSLSDMLAAARMVRGAYETAGYTSLFV